jgi:hypothetical protein
MGCGADLSRSAFLMLALRRDARCFNRNKEVEGVWPVATRTNSRSARASRTVEPPGGHVGDVEAPTIRRSYTCKRYDIDLDIAKSVFSSSRR